MLNRNLTTSSLATTPAEAAGGSASATNRRGRSIGGAVRLLHVLLVASVIVPAAAFAFAAWYGWREIHDQALHQSARIVQVLREHALKIFEAHEFVIDEVEERIKGMDWAAIRASEDVHHYIARLARRQHLVTSVVLVAPDGKPGNVSNTFPPPATDLSDRDYFIAAKAGQRGTIIGEPIAGRITGNRVFLLTRPRTLADGSFDGVIVVAISVSRFAEFYRSITSLDANFVTLARSDGRVLVREPPLAAGGGQFSPNSGFMRTIREGGTVHRTVGELDGIERLHTIMKIGNYPVYVSYGLALTGLRRMWVNDLLLFGLFAAGASICLFSVSLLALQRTRNEQAMVEQWQDEVQRRESAEQALRQTQKMEALGQLTGGVAHDFNNMLMVIGGNIEMLKRKAAGVGADRQIAAIEHAARHGEALTRKLLAFSRRGLVKAKSIELAPFLPKVIDLIKPSLPPKVEIAAELPPDLWPLKADADDLELSLVNIVLNARDAMPDGGVVSISAQNQTLRGDDPATDNLSGDFVALAVRDSGTGISPEHMSRLFEPFFTTKEVGRGTGLGLSQVYGFAKQNGGSVTIASTPGRGTTVTLLLPRAEAPPVEAVPRAEEPVKAGTVLLVEDNQDVAEATVAMLESIGCIVKHASAAEPALEMLAAGEKFDLVLSDIVMPGGVDGVELARRLRTRYPSLAVLLTTGYSNAAQKAAGERFPILLKPYQTEALQRAIGEAVSANGGRRA